MRPEISNITVLTQLDQLRRQSNVFVLTTSNLSASIDLAFVDRADLKQFIDFPRPGAILNILKSGIDELIKVIFFAFQHELLLVVRSCLMCSEIFYS